ncbi:MULTISPECIES: hypothetical protein [unclassified Mycolicibacterium]|nr:MULTISPECIES: hypothetical protein [unclassified Mycolicibacterium]MUL68983.1 hypothetical protein [Mycolicibacterium sp. CBMA 311]MUL92800.1 hypothetical protein [Mycolicibacterium sp. CBMA 230]
MTRAIRLSMPSPTAELEGLAAKVFAAAIPAAAVPMDFRYRLLNAELWELEELYDRPWPVDHVAAELAKWRIELIYQSLNIALGRAAWSFAYHSASFRVAAVPA